MEQTGRERWGGRLPFVMAAIGSAVGLGNVWRFPATAFANGGGAFFIPYFVALITAGIPLMIVEYALGQRYQRGAPEALAQVNRKFRWVGWFALLVGMTITFYYVVVMAYAWHYTAASPSMAWTKPVAIRRDGQTIPADRIVLYQAYPEAGEDDDDATKERKREARERLTAVAASLPGGRRPLILSESALKEREAAEAAKPEGERKHYVKYDDNMGGYFSEKCLGGFRPGEWGALFSVDVELQTELERKTIPRELIEAFEKQKRPLSQDAKVSPDEGGAAWLIRDGARKYAIKQEAEKRDDGTNGEVLRVYDQEARAKMWQLSPKLVLWSLVTWVVMFIIIALGVKNVGRVVLITVPLPVLLLLIILIRGITLPGAGQGILYYLKPNWSMLGNSTVWIRAYGQVFFSLSLGFGILIAYASYQPRESDITNNAFITSFANCATSFIAGFAVFSVLGYLAYANNVEVSEVVARGPGLVFVTYPVALSKMPGAFWGMATGVLFFLCLLSLGIDSAFSIVEGVLTGFADRSRRVSKTLLVAILCVVGFLLGLNFCTHAGLMWLDIVDNWMSNYGLALVGLLECIAVGYFFNLRELKKFVNERSEIQLGSWFDLFVKVVTPGVLLYLLGLQVLKDIDQTYGGYDSILPHAVNVAGWGWFFLIMVLATLLGRNWKAAAFIGSALILFAAFYAVLGDVGAAAMGSVGTVLLFGGLLVCLKIALSKSARPSPPPEQS